MTRATRCGCLSSSSRLLLPSRRWRIDPLPAAYSPDYNPIEQLFAELKALLGKAAAQTRDQLWSTIGHLLDACPTTGHSSSGHQTCQNHR
jgi:hypothetical protein